MFAILIPGLKGAVEAKIENGEFFILFCKTIIGVMNCIKKKKKVKKNLWKKNIGLGEKKKW